MESPASFLLRRLAEEGRDDLIEQYKEHNRAYQQYIAEKRRARSKELSNAYKERDEQRKNEICSECGKTKSSGECMCVTWYVQR